MPVIICHALLSMLLILLAAPVVHATPLGLDQLVPDLLPPERPEPEITLPDECPERQAWEGESEGNDHVAVRLVLCGDVETGSVAGEYSTASPDGSGWSRRHVSGFWQGNLLMMSDERIAEAHPNEGWIFCTAEQYTLRLTPDGRLVGSSSSEDCDDDTIIELRSVDD